MSRAATSLSTSSSTGRRQLWLADAYWHDRLVPSGNHAPEPVLQRPGTQNVSANVSSLAPCTTYHFQLVANNPDGSAAGGDKTFTTTFAPSAQERQGAEQGQRRQQIQGAVHAEYPTKVKIVIKRKNGAVVSSTQ